MITTDSTASLADREIVLSRVFDAPRELVWRAFIDSDRLAQWWGPRGFTTRTQRLDVRPGGAWRFVMIGPDGREYQNLITYLEVAAPGRLRYQHGGDRDVEPVNFEVTVTLDRHGGAADRTRVTMRSLFDSKDARDFVVREYNAVEGGKQTLARLAEQVGAAGSVTAAPLGRPFVMTRVFGAPRELVWDAWTQREHLVHWMGPKGTKIARASLDLRPGGLFHYGMQAADGTLLWGKWLFREIARPERLVVVVSFADEHAGITRHPFAPDWPLETLSTMTFAEHAGVGGGTTVVLEWMPINAAETERRMFAASHASMAQGWSGTMEQFAAYLATLPKG
jgi:uncharacterized protein YndB with AHSA1/START domain